MTSFGKTFYATEPTPTNDNDIMDDALDAINRHYKVSKITLGSIQRFSTNTKKRGDKSGWYFFDLQDGVLFGSFGCWRDGTTHAYTSKNYHKLNSIDQQRIRAQIESRQREQKKALLEGQEQVSNKAVDLYKRNKNQEAGNHTYLIEKGVTQTKNVFNLDGNLYIPLLDGDNKIWNFQVIYTTSSGFVKRYYKPIEGVSGKKQGCFHPIDGKDDTVLICEGYSTGATLHQTTGKTVICAMDAGNIPKVVKALKKVERYSKSRFLICCDNDHNGKSIVEAKKTGCDYIEPPRNEKSGYDFNDYFLDGHDVNAFIFPKVKRSFNFEDIIKDHTPPDFLIHKLIPSESVGMIHGASGGGKSFLVLDMAYHIANGMDWCGKKTKKADVFYLAGEGIHGLKYRAIALQQRYNRSLRHMHGLAEGLNLNTASGYDKTEKAIQEVIDEGYKPKVIFVDTLHRYLSGDENSAQDAKTMIDACDALKTKFNTTVILVHHTGLGEGAQARARGSSAWKGAMDFEYNVKKDADVLTFSCRKMKDAEEHFPIVFDFDMVTLHGIKYDNGDSVTSRILCHNADRKPPKTPSPAEEKRKDNDREMSLARNLIMDVWNVEKLQKEGRCFFKQKVFIQFLIENMGKTPTEARNMTRIDQERRWMSKIVKAGLLEKILLDGGPAYQVVDTSLTFSLKNQKTLTEKDLSDIPIS